MRDNVIWSSVTMKIRPPRIRTEEEWDEIARKNLPLFVKEYKSIIDAMGKRANALLNLLSDEERKKAYYTKLTKLLREDPESEYWVPASYFPYSPKNFNINKKNPRAFSYIWVSNKGRVFNLRTYKLVKGTLNHYGYKVYMMNGYTMMIHRMVGSSWIPKPEELNLYDYSELEVNHLKGKDCNDTESLEWVTPTQNKQHAKENNLLVSHKHLSHPFVIPMKGTVIDIPGFKKRVIYVCGKDQCEKFGLSNRNLHSIRIGIAKTYKGCKWEEVTKEEYTKYYKDPDQDLINAIRNYAYDRTGRKSNRSDGVTWELTHKRTKCVTRLTGTIELANFGTNSANMNRSYKNNGMYKNYFIKRIEPE